jgi:hypothetical protein
MFGALIVFTFLISADLIRMNMQTLVFDGLKNNWYLINEVLIFFTFSFLAFKVLTKPTLFEGMIVYEQQTEH